MLTGRKLDLPTLDSLTSTRSQEDVTKLIMNNENFTEFQKGMRAVTLNSEFSLCGLMQPSSLAQTGSIVKKKYITFINFILILIFNLF